MSAERAIDLCVRSFGARPSVVASAPGRVNLIGEHTDYTGGEVLPMAIGQRTWVAMVRADGPFCRAVSSEAPGSGAFRVDEGQPVGRWWDYVHGPMRELAALGVVGAVHVAVVSTVPRGAGLSSSAALEVATSLAALQVLSAGGPDVDVAQVAHRAETGFVGVACGVMDQTVSAHARVGHALRLWCDSNRIEHVPFERGVLVIDTNVPRGLRHSEYNTRRASCDVALAALQKVHPHLRWLAHATPEMVEAIDVDHEVRRRARHVVTETRRVGDFVAAVTAGRPLGPILAASHESLRGDYECSTPQLDWVVDYASKVPGVDGARLTGAGWGGCAIAVGDHSALREMAQLIGPEFHQRWQRQPSTWLTNASEGARIDWIAAS